MDREKLEKKAKELFTEQDLDVEAVENGFLVKKPGLEYTVLSSGEFTREDVVDASSRFDKVFVDEGFEPFEQENISVIHKDSGNAPETPSYELIGNVAVISELPDMGEEEAVEAILEHHPHVETVLLKQEGLKGEFRVGDYRKLYGEETETVHTEFGCEFLVDPTEAYYSERFSTERDRVVSQIQEGEEVLVMFAGVGPFAIMAARNASPSRVVGIEKNPEAAEYFRKNVERNNLKDTVEVIEGDVAEEADDLGSFDRVIMPLPGSADKFLQEAFRHTYPEGLIHYYRFVEDEVDEPVIEEIKDAARETGKEFELVARTVCGHRGPSVERVCFDIKIES